MLIESQKNFVRRQTETLMGLALQMDSVKNRLHDELPKVDLLEEDDLRWLLNNVSPEAVWFRMKLQMELEKKKGGI